MEVVSKKINRIHEMDVSHIFGSNNSFSPSGLIWDNHSMSKHVLPNNHGNVEIDKTFKFLVSYSLKHVK